MASAEYGHFGDANTAILTRRAWSDELHFQVQNKLFFTQRGFIGPDKGAEDGLEDTVAWYPVVQKEELGGNQGDSVRIGLLRQLANSGVTGNSALTTAVEAMDFDGFLVWVEMIRHATGWQSKMSQQSNRFHTKQNAARLLIAWMAQQMDDSVFDAFYRGASAHVVTEISAVSATQNPNQYYGGNATADADLTPADVFNTAVLERMATWADDNNINPCMMENGEAGHVCIIHPYQMHTLRADDRWHNANAEAMPRGFENPIFSKADGVYAGITIHVSRKVEVPTSGPNAANIRRAIFMGAHSVARAVVQRPEIIPNDESDFGRLHEWAIDCIFGDRRADYERDDSAGNSDFNQSSSIWNTWSENPVS